MGGCKIRPLFYEQSYELFRESELSDFDGGYTLIQTALA
jgi:hypothetical protein